MQKYSPFIQLYLRLALSTGYLTLGLDRLGVWGRYGQKGISWGDWQHFMVYAGDVMHFLPPALVNIFAVMATAAEISFGLLLLTGKWTRAAAIGSGMLTLLFGISMAISHGITDPIGYSVFTVSAGSFLLATVSRYSWGIDDWFEKRNIQLKENKKHGTVRNILTTAP